MANSTRRQLARELARMARWLDHEYEDYASQLVVYGRLLRRWGIDSHELYERLSDRRAVSHIEQVLDSIDLDAVRRDYESEGKDPAVYFYEDFLRAYDPASARGRGVHYSPPEVVSYMVRGVDFVLRESFGESLTDAFVLDPCCGVGTFLRHVERQTDHRPKMLGTELMDAPKAIASSLLRHSRVIQADGLDDIELDTEGRTLVILGNPPYSGHSSNAGKLADLLVNYRAGLKERNPKWLQDDYVKFLRMAQHRVESAGRGIVAFITNHSYLFNPTFRAMRSSLMRAFDEIRVLDLHGNVKRLEKADENVFPIQMGVAISFLVKNSDSPRCNVRYAELRGTRTEKLDSLRTMDFAGTPWVEVQPPRPFHTFTPTDSRLSDEFYGLASLFDIFGESSIGFVTSRDAFAVGFTREEVLERIAAIRNGRVSDDELRSHYSVGDLDIEAARRSLLGDPDWESRAVEALYRPFDRRWVYYSRTTMERPRLPFMENLMMENVALAIGRAGQATGSEDWDVVFCTDRPTDLNLFRRGGAMLFPRYAYQAGGRRSNIRIETPDPDCLFNFIYALLHSAAYRERYAQFLEIDYPRVPIPLNKSVMSDLANLGSELMRVHLMREEGSSHDAIASMRIGGYEVPAKYMKDHGLSESEHIARIRYAVARTIELRRQIDEVVEASPPWQHTQDRAV